MSRSGSAGGATFPADPGRIDEDGETCDHCRGNRGKDAVYRVPDPEADVPTVVALCPYHLRVLQREYTLWWHDLRDHPEIDGLERAAAHEGVFVELGDVPEELPHDGVLYERLGVDERGKAYFVTEGSTHLQILEAGQHFDGEVSEIVPEAFEGFLEHVDGEFGWRKLESEWVERAHGWSE